MRAQEAEHRNAELEEHVAELRPDALRWRRVLSRSLKLKSTGARGGREPPPPSSRRARLRW